MEGTRKLDPVSIVYMHVTQQFVRNSTRYLLQNTNPRVQRFHSLLQNRANYMPVLFTQVKYHVNMKLSWKLKCGLLQKTNPQVQLFPAPKQQLLCIPALCSKTRWPVHMKLSWKLSCFLQQITSPWEALLFLAAWEAQVCPAAEQQSRKSSTFYCSRTVMHKFSCFPLQNRATHMPDLLQHKSCSYEKV